MLLLVKKFDMSTLRPLNSSLLAPHDRKSYRFLNERSKSRKNVFFVVENVNMIKLETTYSN